MLRPDTFLLAFAYLYRFPFPARALEDIPAFDSRAFLRLPPAVLRASSVEEACFRLMAASYPDFWAATYRRPVFGAYSFLLAVPYMDRYHIQAGYPCRTPVHSCFHLPFHIPFPAALPGSLRICNIPDNSCDFSFTGILYII